MSESKVNGERVSAPPAQAPAVVSPPQQTALVRVGYDTEQGFVALQRVATAFAKSSLVPEVYGGNVANCIIAVEMAQRMGASPLMVMQNLYLVHGRPSWASQFLIASFNHCGRFAAIRYRWSGERGKPTWGCTAYATERETGEEVRGPEVTMKMANDEGWIGKKGSKWATMPELMLTYRAATFLVRTVAPELTMGLRTVDENEDIYGIGGGATEHAQQATAQHAAAPSASTEPTPTKGTAGLKAALKASEATVEAKPADPPHDPVTGEVLDDAPPDVEDVLPRIVAEPRDEAPINDASAQD